MEINKFTTKEEASAGAGEVLNKLLEDNKDIPVLLLLASGSALSILDFVNGKAMGENLTITMLDERFSKDPTANNFLQLQKLDFFNLALSNNANFIGTLPRPTENMDDMRTRLELGLKNWISKNQTGKIFATIGMGADGHTAGIFPNKDANFFETAFDSSHIITAYKAECSHKFPERVTATLSLFKKIDQAIVYICGEDKKIKLTELIAGKEQANNLPAVGIFQTKHFQIFTDILI